MFLTRSIRRKLVLSLSLVMAMLGLLAFGAISGLLSYRSVVNDLEYTITKAPRRGDLINAISVLYRPLYLSEAQLPKDSSTRKLLWKKQIEIARQGVQDFHRRLEEIPHSQLAFGQRPMVMWKLEQLYTQLKEFEQLISDDSEAVDVLDSKTDAWQPFEDLHNQEGHFQDPLQSRTKLEPWRKVLEMAETAANVQSPEEHLGKKLDEAKKIYKSRLSMVSFALVVTVILFAGLIRCAYVWIFVPIRMLHQGAARVALGDFDYRVKLTGKDEMAELAGTFNQVVERFQEIKHKLDNEVHERSRQLVRSERLAGVGFLAAGVAHEINNPLSAIAMAAESLEGRVREAGLANGPPPPEDVAQVAAYLGMIQKEAFRCQQITARLLDFARGQDAPKTRQDLSKIVGEVLDLVSHLSKFRGHKIVFDRQKTCYAEANGAEIKQVALNLVANALESMEGQGVLKVDLEERADEVILSFRDTGCGMTPYVIENLFEPFFTERKSGKGTGLGLSISHRIVSEHGGRIEALSDGPGTGSCFRVHLPRKANVSLRQAA